MRILKWIAGIIISLLLIALVLSFVLPKDISIDVQKNLNAPPVYVYNVIQDVGSQSTWNTWKEQDESMEFTYSDRKKGIGATYQWTSDKFGSGSSEIVAVTPYDSILIVSQLGSGEEAKSTYYFQENGKKTNTIWHFDGYLSWPSNVMGPLLKRSMNKSMNRALELLNDEVVQRYEKGKYHEYEVAQSIVTQRNYVIQRSEVPKDNVIQYYTQNLAPIFLKIQKAGVEMEGHPASLFFSYDEKNDLVDMAAAIPIKEDVNIAETNAFNVELSRAVTVDYYGDHKGIQKAHDAIDAYLKDRNLLHDYPVIEEYITDPSEEKDPSKWLTKIIYYLTE